MLRLATNSAGYSLFENIKKDINKEFETIPTKSIESKVHPLMSQVIALLHHKCCTTNVPLAKNISTDHSIHVVSAAVSQTVQAARVVALNNSKLKNGLDAACKEAVTAGESLCRLLTQQSNQGLSPSSSQTGTDSGVEDIDDESGSEILQALSHHEERLNMHRWILNDLQDRRENHSIEPLNALGNDDISSTTSYSDDDIKRSELASACRNALQSVIKVLTLADQTVVMEILDSVEQVLESLGQMKKSLNFHMFMQEFSTFGTRIIHLAQLTGERQQDLRKEEDRAHISSSRSVLEKGTSLCLATSKLCYQHSTSCLARQCRDHCFERMRVALKRIAGVVETPTGGQQSNLQSMHVLPKHSNDITDLETSLVKCTLEKSNCKHLHDHVTLFRILDLLKEFNTSRNPSADYDTNRDIMCKNTSSQIHGHPEVNRLKEVSDHLKTFTNSPYISYEGQTRIRRAFGVLEIAMQPSADFEKAVLFDDDVTALEDVIRVSVISQLHDVTMMLTKSHSPHDETHGILEKLTKADIRRDNEDCKKTLKRFKDISKRAYEACCMARECFSEVGLIVTTDHVIECLSDLTEQVSTSIHIVQSLRDNHLAFENLQLFAKQWQGCLITELDFLVSALTKPISATSGQNRPVKMEFQNTKEHTTVARLGLEIKLLTAQCRVEYEQWKRLPNTGQTIHLLCSVKKIVEAAWNVFNFTNGQPPLTTTADLFTCIAEINKLADEYAHYSKSILDDQNEFIAVSGKLRFNVSSASLELPSACNCLKTTLRMSAHGRSAVFQKVATSLQKLKTVLDLVSRLTISLHSVSLEKNLLPRIPENDGTTTYPVRPRHRDMTSRFMTKFNPVTSSSSRIRNSSQERARQCS